VDKRTRVTQALMDDAPKIARVAIDGALAGDLQGAGLVLSRVAHQLKWGSVSSFRQLVSQ
jgi:hypothetical protein